jgi:DNA helicase-2/ATP-dependent DNA helicase PcrA
VRRFVLHRDPDGPPALDGLALDYAGALNPQQLAAATAPDGPTLVVAGAGTGKTRTLVYRVAYLVERGVRPEEIVLLTFTRRAARAMLARAASLLDGRCEQVRGGTFHAFGLSVLRRYAGHLGFDRRFSVLDASDAADVLDVLRTEAGLQRSDKRFPRKATLHAMFSAALNRDLPLADVLEEGWPQFLVHLDPLEALRAAYDAFKQANRLMDYDDLLARPLALFARHEAVRTAVAGACRHVLVDEYQDVNRLQARLVEALTGVHGNVTAVGDDAQSIYRFRGADVGHILRFPDFFRGTRVLKLEQNYRSTQPILDLANHVLARATAKYDKTLFTARPGGDLPALVQAPDESWQSRFVCQVVLEKREAGVPLGRMAVLFRAGWCSYDLETELNRRRIPFVKYGGLKLTEAAHVKDLVAHLRVAENPGDAPAWNRVLKLLEGLGPKTAQQLLEWVRQAEHPWALEVPFASDRYVEGLRRLGALLTALREAEDPLAVQIEHLLAYYRPLFERVYSEDFPKREADLDGFAAVAARYRDRPALLEALALDPLDLSTEEVEAGQKDESPLILSTIHSAKGLEFDTVFLIDALEGVLPSLYSLKRPEELDEELRLLYVALTRAENALFVSYPVVQHQRRAGEFFTEPSRFLQDVPEQLLEPWALVEDAAPRALPPGPLERTNVGS